MSHHSSGRIPSDLAAMFGNLDPSLGPTGAFPAGKLAPSDEGEIRIGLTHVDGKVVFDFGKPIAWIGFTPAEGREIAALIVKNCDAAERESGKHE